MRNTLRTVIGFLGTLITRYTPLDLSRATLSGIFNYLPINDSITTSGQPTEAQFRLVQGAGFRRVINLAPHGGENALPDEAATLGELGIEYTYIPVDFQAPTEDDFQRFCHAMAESGSEPVWVHCAANMRVSAFVYRYRRDVLHEDTEAAARDLHQIWEPFGVWKGFVAPRA
ncbi:MAG: protein tyrosine phosphatase family protein [Myxococcota bacterium]|jgi:protein tyrosine phosphatase (PTP) superfamily phosphohydrolase (DUF442 family)